MKLRPQRGFSLLEMLIVVSIALILAGVSFIAMMPMLNQSHLDSAYDTTLNVLRSTREFSITQGHEYVVTFSPAGANPLTNPASILVQYQPPANPPGSALPPLQNVNTYTLPYDINFAVRAGFPASAPDNFGTGIVAIDFGQTLGAGNLPYVTFMPDGSSRDTNASSSIGNYNSGVVYLNRGSDPTIYSSRAITVWGATGRIRGWRLVQPGGPKWVQQ